MNALSDSEPEARAALDGANASGSAGPGKSQTLADAPFSISRIDLEV
jgi:hypothetical protein